MCSKDLQSVLIFLSCKMKVDILCVCMCVRVCVCVCNKKSLPFLPASSSMPPNRLPKLESRTPFYSPFACLPTGPPPPPLPPPFIHYLFIIIYLFCPPLAKCMRIAEIIPAAEAWQQHSLFQLSPECVVSDAP